MTIATTYEQYTLFAQDLPDHSLQLSSYVQAGLTQEIASTLEIRAARIISIGRRAILEIGGELLEARQEAAYGTWGAFLARCGLEERTAQNYMGVAEKFADQPELIAALPATALYAMAAPSADPVAVAEVVAEVQAGARPSVDEVKQRVSPPKADPSPSKARGAAPTKQEGDPAPTTPAAPAVALTPMASAPPPPALIPLIPTVAEAEPAGEVEVIAATSTASEADLAELKRSEALIDLLLQAVNLVEGERDRLRRLCPGAPRYVLSDGPVETAARSFIAAPAVRSAAALLAMNARAEG